jgi:hypothetical protein
MYIYRVRTYCYHVVVHIGDSTGAPVSPGGSKVKWQAKRFATGVWRIGGGFATNTGLATAMPLPHPGFPGPPLQRYLLGFYRLGGPI